MEFIKKRIEQFEHEQGVKADVDKDNLDQMGLEELLKISATYGLTIREFFNPSRTNS